MENPSKDFSMSIHAILDAYSPEMNILVATAVVEVLSYQLGMPIENVLDALVQGHRAMLAEDEIDSTHLSLLDKPDFTISDAFPDLNS